MRFATFAFGAAFLTTCASIDESASALPRISPCAETDTGKSCWTRISLQAGLYEVRGYSMAPFPSDLFEEQKVRILRGVCPEEFETLEETYNSVVCHGDPACRYGPGFTSTIQCLGTS